MDIIQDAQLLKAFCYEGAKQLDKIASSFAARDWGQYCVVVHGIKSSLRIIGASELGEFAYRLELASKDGGDLNVCIAETDDFLKKVSDFAQTISADLNESASQSQDKTQTEESALKDLLARLLKVCRNFNLTAADTLSNELKEITINPEIDKRLEKIIEQVDMIEYADAAESIEELLSETWASIK